MLKLALLFLANGRRRADQREAIEAAASNPKLLAKVKAEAIRLEEKRTGKKLGKIGDGKLLEIIRNNLPQIIAFIMSLFA